jgi:hypothetical protein
VRLSLILITVATFFSDLVVFSLSVYGWGGDAVRTNSIALNYDSGDGLVGRVALIPNILL